ncbi:MAG: insulinase family protein, partial [Spirochaetales bacterium]|nr:insulinase family protein [Spirochaetales bacterium]
RYADRLPIGVLDVIRNAPREEFIRFYRRWYRPDNMAFIAVGDLPAQRMTELIEQYLSDLPRPTAPLARPAYTVPRQRGTRVSIASDPEASQHTVSIYILDDPSPFSTVGDYRELLVRYLFSSIVNERMRDIARDPDSPITAGGVGYNRFLRDTEIAVGTAVVRDDRVTEALAVLTTEIERARRYGVLESELERARSRFFQSIEEARVNFSSRPSAALAAELIRHWTEGEAMPGIEFEYRLYRELLPGISASEVSEVARDFVREDGRVILAALRTGTPGRLPDGAPLPTEAELSASVRAASSTALAPPEDDDVGATLMASPPREGTIIAMHEHAAVDAYEYHLSNGMRLFVRPTDFSEDEILFSAYSPGGLALVEDSSVAAAQIAADVASESGLGALDAGALENVLAGRSVNFSASIGRTSEGMAGSSRAADLETLFQMINLAFTAPRFDERALENVRRGALQAIRGAAASPQGRFSTALQEAFAAGDPRLRVAREEEVEAVTLDEIRRVYRERFALPSDFALFFVGSVDPEEVARLAERYLAGIGSVEGGGRPWAAPRDTAGFIETVHATAYPRPEGVVREEVRAGAEPVAQLAMVLHGPYRWSREENHRFNSLADYLDIRMREVIREEAGGAYSVGAGGWRWRRPEEWAFMQVAFGLSPDRVEELRTLAFGVIEEARTTAPTESYLERVKAQQRDAWEQNVRENGYWLSTIAFFVEHGRDLADIPDFPELIDSLTTEDILDSARRYLDPERRIEVLLLPEDG